MIRPEINQHIYNSLCRDFSFIDTFQNFKKLIVGEVEVIPDLPSYSKYWRNKFARLFEESQLEDEGDSERADDILSKVLAQYTTCLQMDVEKSDITSQYLEVKKDESQQNFYFLFDVLQEDKDLRASSWQLLSVSV